MVTFCSILNLVCKCCTFLLLQLCTCNIKRVCICQCVLTLLIIILCFCILQNLLSLSSAKLNFIRSSFWVPSLNSWYNMIYEEYLLILHLFWESLYICEFRGTKIMGFIFSETINVQKYFCKILLLGKLCPVSLMEIFTNYSE